MSARNLLIRIVTFLGGLYFFLKFVLPEQTGFSAYHSQIADGFVLVGAMALALGLINLLMVHGTRLLYLRKGWPPSVALLVGLFLMLSITTLDWRATNEISKEVQRVGMLKDFSDRIVADASAGVVPQSRTGEELTPSRRNQYLIAAVSDVMPSVETERASLRQLVLEKGDDTARALFDRSDRDFAEAVSSLDQARNLVSVGEGEFQAGANIALSKALGQISAAYRGMASAGYSTSLLRNLYSFLFEGLFVSLGSAMFSLLGFYICAAAYRAFRFKSMESLLMMSAALLVMLGQIPFGLWISESLPEIRLWLLQVPSAAAARAIEMGASVAGLVMAFRMWLSIESESFK